MDNILLVVTKNGVKYQVGTNKSVTEVLKSVNSASPSSFYLFADTCAVKVSEISSIETFENTTEEEVGE